MRYWLKTPKNQVSGHFFQGSVHEINNWIVTGHLPVSRRGFTIVCLDENYPSCDLGAGITFHRDKSDAPYKA